MSCWGSNFVRFIADNLGGDGAGAIDSRVPVRVEGIDNAVLLSAGERHTCALIATGRVRCWGLRGLGMLGDGSYGPGSSAPIDVVGIDDAVDLIQCGTSDFSCALLSGGSVRCWGINTHGQLGNGQFGYSTTPVAVVGLGGNGAGLSPNEAILHGSWYDPATSGQGTGFDIIRSGEQWVLFATWYTYSLDGSEKLWFTLQGVSEPAAATQTLDLFVTDDGVFNRPPAVSARRVGSGTFRILSPTQLRLDFNFDEADPRWPADGWMTLTKLAGNPGIALNLQERQLEGSWYNPVTSGQGLNIDLITLDHGPAMVFMPWYTYSADGSQRLWLTLQGRAEPDDESVITLDILLNENGRFNQPPATPAERFGLARVRKTSLDTMQVAFEFDTDDPRWQREGTMTLQRIGEFRP